MLEKQERLAVLILVAVLIVCGGVTWVLETMGKEPFSQRYSPDLSDGTLVDWDGVVQKITPVGSGSSLIMDVGGVQVFTSASTGSDSLTIGDHISLYGEVQTWKGKREIMVSDETDIRIISESQGKNLRS